MARKPGMRKKAGQVSFRVNDWVMERYSRAVEETAGAVATGGGNVLNQSANFEWWANWWGSLPPGERARWSRAYRAAFYETLEEREPRKTRGLRPPAGTDGTESARNRGWLYTWHCMNQSIRRIIQ